MYSTLMIVDNTERYASNQRTQDKRLYYLQLWRLNAIAEGRQSTYIRFEVLRVHGLVLTVRKNEMNGPVTCRNIQ